ncbi:Oxa1Ec,putative inner membrane protein translocase component YidC,membrane protein insertase, YidC/Oxa1 family,60Kd inner membrane protein [Chlamydia serpentis]|uniref:Membrane protein insertase YidC n=1 Tax=Chlamydia serpentis TaxID=1967782 RepID=A0A2R8FAN4_9CHLA|nr:membrane protein insertase YidC [Chlamydia serpentis]SPN73454.1 Oxa1Ec,putative inner membrane protein translocase component YidC,membrane protein insertase, YidC/Oxa1 family,60Kd inner membrane protein [Chlamydia serpentis]
MNKRTLLFVSLVGIAFVGCQIFFGYNEFRSCKNLAEKQRRISEQTLSAVESVGLSVTSWDKTLDSEAGKNNYAVRVGNSLFLLHNGDPVQGIYSSGEPWSFVDQVHTCDNIYVALYHQQGSFGSHADVGKVFLPTNVKGLPVLVVEFRNQEEPLVFLGEYADGKIFNKDSTIFGTSLVFWKSGNEYLPLGLYDSRQEKLISLDLPTTRAVIFDDQDFITSSNSSNHYVLFNQYMQIVVSQESGSIEGINLPFVSTSDKSIVNEIGFDRELASGNSPEAFFPGVISKLPDGSQEKNSIGGYYPLLRRGLLNDPKKLTPMEYHALNVVSGRELATPLALGYRILSYTSNLIHLESLDGSLQKVYKLPENPEEKPYVFETVVTLTKEVEDLWITSGIPEVEIMSNASVPTIKYRTIKKNKGSLDKVKLPKVKEPLALRRGIYPQWILNSNGYFGIILTPTSEISSGYGSLCIPGNTVPTRLSAISPKNQAYPASKYPGYESLLPLPKAPGTYQFLIYAGPLAEPTLKVLDKTITLETGENPEYLESISFRGIFAFITAPFAALLFIIMKFFNLITNSWGISIILLTVFLKLLLYPLNAWSIRSMRRMQILSPYIQEIQKKYKNEPKRAQMEIMGLYKTNKVNPITGCLPLLIQLPFLIAMFDLLKSSFLLRGASFIPGWIDNLTAPDVLFSWERSLWFIGNQFHLLPILLGIVMFLQQKVTSLHNKKGPITDQQRQQQTMGNMMAILFTAMFYNFPSGLNIYWLSSMLLGVVQQWVTNKILDSKHLKNEVVLNNKKHR